MTEVATIEIDREVADVAARRAAEQGLSTADFITRLLRRGLERPLGEESILAYDHSDGIDDFTLAREPGETDEEYHQRASHFGALFGR
jgi:hypothetical protein